jgi:hypothetical protein
MDLDPGLGDKIRPPRPTPHGANALAFPTQIQEGNGGNIGAI